MPHETDYEVGYKKPPKHSQFKKGQSGNPRGRPRRAKTIASLFSGVLDEKVTVTENGRRHKIAKAEAMLKHLVNDAAQGDIKATQTVLRAMEMLYRYKKAANLRETSSGPTPGAIVVIPHNNRDPLTPKQIAASEEYDAWLRQQGERRNSANENEQEEAPDERSSAG